MPESINSETSCCVPARCLTNPNEASSVIPASSAERADQSDRVEIPGGHGFLGTNDSILPIDGEGPLRKTKIKPFLMDQATVTNERFAKFVDATGYITQAEQIGDSFVFSGLLPDDFEPTRGVAQTPWWREIKGANWRFPLGPDNKNALEPEHPVVHVSWNDANAFAKWAGGRLPTEAEWEHAARGGLGDVRFPWGDQAPDDQAYFPCNIWQGQFPQNNLRLDGYFATAPAVSFDPNTYGLFNMVGNVWEYTSQGFTIKSLKKSAREHPAVKNRHKLLKGGSFLCHISYCFRYRIAARTGTSSDSSTSHQGFRLVYDL